ncbi:MAG TPA: Ig-like domain-containing protein [Gemmatimonadales bacterium]|nr:Ig-like domain-containing protein [Gemmatimonadales bacterium]
MARPAAGASRQAQVAGLLVATLAGACAKTGEPPGGPPRTTAPKIERTVPESGAIVPELKGDAVIAFDEVIDEMPASAGPKGTITGLAAKVVLSPVAGEVKVSWHRSAIHVKPAEGWKPNRVYHLELLSGIADLRRNTTKQRTLVVFSTGDTLPSAVLTGTALLWVEQRALAQAIIRAARLPDTVAYVTVADSVGDFRLSEIPAGRYLVWAIQDQNNNRVADRREAFDTVRVTVDSGASALLWAFVHDTVGPRLRSVDPLDSTTFRLVFSQPLDPRHPLDTTRVRLYALPDTTPVRVAGLLAAAQYDSLQARARAVADSLRRARDTTARRDTARARAPAPAGPRAPGAAAGAARPPQRDTSAARVDTTRVHRLLGQRPVPSERLVVRVAAPLVPGAKYLVRVRGATNLTGAAADAQGVLVVPVPRPARDTTKAKPKTR